MIYDNIIQFYNEQQILFYMFVAIIGACVGSFLNVVIYRTPVIIKRLELEYLSSLYNSIELNEGRDSLPATLWGRSFCSFCNTMIPAKYNIPIFGYIFLRGKTNCCSKPFSFRYPAIEALTSILFCAITFLYGPTVNSILLIIAMSMSISLFFIDYDEFLLPDIIVYQLLWLGVINAIVTNNIALEMSIYGIISGYMSLYILSKIFYLLRGVAGMGNGDFKLLAAIGAWIGPMDLAWVVIYSVLATFILTALSILNRDPDLGDEEQSGVPYGPGLLIGFWVCIFLEAI